MANKVIQNILDRKSTRAYLDKRVSISKLEQILEAGNSAPSAMNMQSCRIVALRNKKQVEQLRQLAIKTLNRDVYYGASTLVLVIGDSSNKFYLQDGSCILENMFIAARALGIDSCWINQTQQILALDNITIEGNKELLQSARVLRKTLSMADHEAVVGTCILGYKDPAKEVNRPVKKKQITII